MIGTNQNGNLSPQNMEYNYYMLNNTTNNNNKLVNNRNNYNPQMNLVNSNLPNQNYN